MDFPQGFDLKALRIFLVVSEHGSMTEAAQRLGLTQSTISQIISNLEAAVGTQLLDRSMRPMALTTAGSTLFASARALLLDAGDALQSTRGTSGQPLPDITLAVADSIASTVIPQVVSRLTSSARRWRVWSEFYSDAYSALSGRTVDLTITTSLEDTPGDRFQIVPFIREPFVLALPNRLADHDGELEALSEHPFIRFSLRSSIGRMVERQVQRLRLDLPVSLEFDLAVGQLVAVSEGLGWCITTPLCLLQNESLMQKMTIRRLPRGRFFRDMAVSARQGEHTELAEKLALTTETVIREKLQARFTGDLAWVLDDIIWPNP
ncbi:LysR family transcriptional regulator [Coralliovum pocilloporae]|uniref:LysR family transcriptional regulator n=1 Tax=Coralliovum pocilloporae TaxID=3066369 RepID=UPI00330773F2